MIDSPESLEDPRVYPLASAIRREAERAGRDVACFAALLIIGLDEAMVDRWIPETSVSSEGAGTIEKS